MAPKFKSSTLTGDEAGARIEALEQENRLLRLELRLLRIKHFGASSEKLSDGQLELMEAEPSVEKEEIENEAALLPEAKEEADRQVKRSRQGIHPGREPLPAHLPRVEQIIVCSPDLCHCGQCRGENKVIGYERTEVLD